MKSKSLIQYCEKWNLSEPSPMASTFTSDVFKVKFNGVDAVLKILNEKGQIFEAKGASVLSCFGGKGAVRLFKADEGAHLLEFIDGEQLKTLVDGGKDTQATDIICDVIKQLHSYSGKEPDDLINMERNFRSLFKKVEGERVDSIYFEGAKVAGRLIGTEQEVRVLHGDIHQENILKSSQRGWLAIDPQCLVGERTYDVANTFYNPKGFLGMSVLTEAIERRCQIFSQRLNLDQKRILEFAFAYGCLSAAWCIEDGHEAAENLQIARSIWNVLSELR